MVCQPWCMADVVVLLHLTREDAWAPVTRLLDSHRVTLVDVPGFGESEVPRGTPPTMAGLAGVLHGNLAERGLSGAYVVGLSMAGTMALELARLGGPAGVVAISPPGFWSRAQGAAVCAEIVGLWGAVRAARPLVRAAGRSDLLRRQVWDRVVAAPERMPREVMDSTVLGVPHNMRHLTADLLHGAAVLRAIPAYRVGPLATDVPITVAWGDRDVFTDFRTQSARARKALPRARHVTLRGCGHIPMFDDPEQVARTILDSIDPLEGGSHELVE